MSHLECRWITVEDDETGPIDPSIVTQDKVIALLGRYVRVTLDHGGYPDPKTPSVIVQGQFLGFGDGGDIEILTEDGFTHYCWPMLEIEAAPDLQAHADEWDAQAAAYEATQNECK